MAKTVSATEAARRFSDMLNRVHFRGERYTIARGGRAVASLGPAEPAARLTLAHAIEALDRLPSLGADAASFAKAVLKAGRKAPKPPRRSAWD